MAAKVTIQDIADALGLSRNTVSKAINNTGVLADSTRERVLLKAQEMGYKQFSYMQFPTGESNKRPDAQLSAKKREIAVLLAGLVGTSHFASSMLDRFQSELSTLGFSMTIYRILPEELSSCRLPKALNLAVTAGIMCVEVFDAPYCRMLCGLSVPLLLVDSPVHIFEGSIDADILLMDNQRSMYELIRHLQDRGKTKIGYVGDIYHCQSFYERYSAFRQCTEQFGLQDTGSITERFKDDQPYAQFLETRLDPGKLPEVFVCANDFVALELMHALECCGLSVPQDLWVSGFDDAPESRIVTPKLTTIHIHTQAMGQTAVGMLYTRILSPEMNYRTVYTDTHLICRESTEDTAVSH